MTSYVGQFRIPALKLNMWYIWSKILGILAFRVIQGCESRQKSIIFMNILLVNGNEYVWIATIPIFSGDCLFEHLIPDWILLVKITWLRITFRMN